MPSRVYKAHAIVDHVYAQLEPYGNIYRQYSVNFAGTNYSHGGRDMVTLRTEWFFTLAAAKQAIRDRWEELRQ